MRPSRGSPHGHIWAAEDTQNLAWPGPASTPALALLPTVKGTLWGQKATHCVRGDKGAGDRGAGRLGGHNNSTRHLLPVQRGRARGEGSLEFPPCALGAFQNPGASTPQLYRRCKGRFRTQPGSADWVRGQASVLRPKKHASSYPNVTGQTLPRACSVPGTVRGWGAGDRRGPHPQAHSSQPGPSQEGGGSGPGSPPGLACCCLHHTACYS